MKKAAQATTGCLALTRLRVEPTKPTPARQQSHLHSLRSQQGVGKSHLSEQAKNQITDNATKL